MPLKSIAARKISKNFVVQKCKIWDLKTSILGKGRDKIEISSTRSLLRWKFGASVGRLQFAVLRTFLTHNTAE